MARYVIQERVVTPEALQQFQGADINLPWPALPTKPDFHQAGLVILDSLPSLGRQQGGFCEEKDIFLVLFFTLQELYLQSYESAYSEFNWTL